MNKTIDTETLLLKVESHEHRIGIMENLLRDAKQREFEIIFKKVKSRKTSNLQRVAIKWSPVKIM